MKIYKVIDDFNQEYIQPAGLVGRLGVCRTTVWRLLNEMQANKKYHNSFLHVSSNLKLVNIKDFNQFMIDRSNKFLKA